MNNLQWKANGKMYNFLHCSHRRILQGKDREAGELLVERHYKRIYKEIYLKTSDEELAKDLTQEAFIQILKNLYQFF